MYRFFETVKIKNSLVCNLAYHWQRMNCTAIHFGLDQSVIEEAIKSLRNLSFEKNCDSRCKLLYDNQGYSFEFSELETRRITSLKIVFDDSVCYSFKYADRKKIELLYDLREDCDDVLIVKNGQLTDTSIANILLFDGKNWITPDSPLLNGTCRQRLIDEGRIEVKRVLLSDLKSFSLIMPINALRDFNLEVALPIYNSVKF